MPVPHQSPDTSVLRRAHTAAGPHWRSRPTLVGAAYFVLHIVTHLAAGLFEVAPGVSLWYPAAGLALAVLVLLGPRVAPVVFAANLCGAWLTADLGLGWSILVFPLLITATYTAAALLVRRANGRRLLPGIPHQTAVFIAATALAPLAVALLGTLAMHWLEPLAWDEFLRTAANWWLGDTCGMLTVVPPVMVFAGPWVRGDPPSENEYPASSHQPLRAALRALALLGSLALVFAVDSVPHTLLFYVCLLPLVWICLRHGLPGATLATLTINLGALLGLRLVDGTLESATAFLLLELTAAVIGLGLGSSVSRRAIAERKLAASEARLERVIAGSQVGLWDWNLQTRQVAFNRRCAELVGLSPDRLTADAAEWQAHMHPDDRDRVASALQEHIEGRAPMFMTDYRVGPGPERERWINSRGSVVLRDDAGRALIVSGSLVDITARRLAKIASERLLQIIESTTDLSLTTDLGGHVLYANAAVLRFCQRADLAAVAKQRIDVLLPCLGEPSLATILATLPSEGIWNGEIQLVSTSGAGVPASLVALLHRAPDGAPDSFSFVLRDISRRKEAEAARLDQERRLLQLQKTESLGVLAGGIAHDFNNLLTAMLGNAGLARCDLPANSPLHEPLAQIETAAHRAADLCQQMLAYAGRRPLAASDVDLNALIRQTQRLFQVSIGKKISVHLDLAPAPVVVRAAPPQLQQVVLNLVINAAEAIGDTTGHIAIRTASREFSAEQLCADFPSYTLSAGRYAIFEIEDSGRGIPPELCRRIFEPFFTTKPTGHGLGLAAVHGVVTSHNGAISVSSAPGHGSTFRIALPLAAAPAAAPAAPEAAPPWSASGLVLVVDDEPSVRRVAARMLSGFGFTTLEAADGVEAVAIFQKHSGSLRLVLLDLLMPRKDGVETFGELHRLAPAVPVVMMSGFTGNLSLDRFPQARPAGMLAKPFSREALQTRLQEVLARN